MNNLEKLVKELCKLPNETQWVEFKHNNCEPTMVGEDISALANSATLKDKSHAYMIWGIDDNTHEIIGTTVDMSKERKGAQELENWLRSLLSKNADFEHEHIKIDGLDVDILIISKAIGYPVSFQKQDYVRIGSYTKNLKEYVALQGLLWSKLRSTSFEDGIAKNNVDLSDILKSLDISRYFDLVKMTQPIDMESSIHYLVEDGLVIKQDDGLFSITNLGAILFAKRLADFPKLGRKALRIVQYDGLNKYQIIKEEIADSGYALCFEDIVKSVSNMLPSKEDINTVRLSIEDSFPIPTIREGIANAIIHQDFSVTGAGPTIELFPNRVEITNPGTPLVDINRIIDNPPKSRNEALAALMRRIDMCEELGRGWDRMVISCEMKQMPAPRISIYEESTKVIIFSKLDYSNIPYEDKIWSLYLHACLMFIQGEALTNSSLRDRFGVKSSNSSRISKLIKDAIEKKIIKPVDPETAPKHKKYVPIWA